MKNSEIAQVFERIAILLEVKGGEPFKVTAYQRAANSIKTLSIPVEKLVEQERLKEIPGVGDAIAKKVIELVTTGHLKYYDDLQAQFPAGLFELLTIPGVGPRTAERLIRELGIKSANELEEAILDGRIARLTHFGNKTAEKILHGIRSRQTQGQGILLGVALPAAEEIIASLGARSPWLENITITGSVRRGKETVNDIDLLVVSNSPASVLQAFTELDQVEDIMTRGNNNASVMTYQGLQVELQVVPGDIFGSFLQYCTGSKQHNSLLQAWAQEKELKLSVEGITDIQTGVREKFADEEDLYHRLGLQYIPPELREGQHEVELAHDGKIPRLVEIGDIKGDLHVHTNWSDGKNSIAEMVQAAKVLGYGYIAITDHSQGMGLIHGLSEERLRGQIAEIKRINQENGGVHVLCGIEVDIRADGTLSLSDEALRELDVVIASIHSGMSEDEAQITRRIISAINNPHVDIIAHPTCRLLGQRDPIKINMEQVLDAARDKGVALEINAMPNRLDLSDVNTFQAGKASVKLVIGTDAHDTEHLSMMRYGVSVARRGWCEAQHIGNTRQNVREYLRKSILV